MEAIKLLKEFAKAQNIDVKEVDKFLNQYSNPETLDELMELPNDMLKHFSWITDLSEPLKEFIKGFEPNRREVITLERIADNLLDNIGYHEYKLQEGSITKEEFDKEIRPYKEIEAQLIKERFGSVCNDW